MQLAEEINGGVKKVLAKRPNNSFVITSYEIGEDGITVPNNKDIPQREAEEFFNKANKQHCSFEEAFSE